MTTYIDPAFRDSLLKKPQDRTAQDLTLITANLKSLEALSALRDTSIRSLCKTVRYVKHESNDVLYKSGDVINCWFILLSGSVFIDGSMFLPRSGFGRRTAGQLCRIHDCLVLETSEMLVIDYPQIKPQKQQQIVVKPSQVNSSLYMHQLSSCSSSLDDNDIINNSKSNNNTTLTSVSNTTTANSSTTSSNVTTINITTRNSEQFPVLNRNSASRTSDTSSSVYSNSDLTFSSLNGNGNHHQIDTIDNQENVNECLLVNNLLDSTLNTTLNTGMTNLMNNDDSINIDIDDDLIKTCLLQNLNANALAAGVNNNHTTVSSSSNHNTTTGSGSHSTATSAIIAYGDDGSVSSEHSMQIKDSVRECLEKDPKERVDEDIDILFEFMQNFPAFSDLTQPIIRQLCACMVLGVVDKADTVVLDHNERLDSWAVVLNGVVERNLPDGSVKTYHVGDHFGVEATLDSVFHEGVMRTKCDDCQFVLIKQNDYYEILNKSKENLTRHMDNGVLVMVSEHRTLNNNTERAGDIVLRGSVDKLLEMLIEADKNALIDQTYIDDFLLTYRTFIECPTYITSKLVEWFQNNSIDIKKKVYRIILLWITNHFNDFEMNMQLYEFLEQFQEILAKDKMGDELRMITIAISTKSKPRVITLARSRRNEQLQFEIKGGWDKGYGIYVAKVERDSKAHEQGLRKGDQILEVNGQLFQYLPFKQASDLLTTYTHLSIKVKYMPMAFNEMLLHPEKSPHRNKKNLMLRANNNFAGVNLNLNSQFDEQQQQPAAINDVSGKISTPRSKSKEPTMNGTGNTTSTSLASTASKFTARGFKFLNKISKATHSRDNDFSSSGYGSSSSAPSLKSITRSPSPSANLYNLPANKIFTTSSSNNGISSASTNVKANINNSIENLSIGGVTANNSDTNSVSMSYVDSTSSSCIYDESFATEHVLKIYRTDQTFKYLVVFKETSAKEVVMLSLKEFNIVDDVGSGAYALCEVSVDQDKVIKQKRLPDSMNNLAEKLPLNARYYLRSNQSSEQFLSDSLAVDELLRDANIQFLQLDALELAAQLTLRDYCLFKTIESTEYIDSLYKIKSKYGCDNLKKFSNLSNEEMFWVIHEILREPSLKKRVEIIKTFIRIARICKECKNFNSLLAILSGLDHLTVSRLKETWEKVSPKYKKLFEELKSLLDPSRNMSKYRQQLKTEFIQPPIIPFFPLCQKDLTFIKEPNDSIVEGLINFDKLRKLSKAIRNTVQMAQSSFDLSLLNDVPTSHTTIFSMFGCTNPNLLNNGTRSYQSKLKMKTEQAKSLYDDAVMVRKVRFYLQNISKSIETNEERLRLISSTLEYSSSGNTLRRKPPSPNSSNTGSLSSINALNSSHNGSSSSSTNMYERKFSLSQSQNTQNSVFGTQSPCAVKKLLSLSETKVKTVKTSSSSSMPLAPTNGVNHSARILTTNTSGSMINPPIGAALSNNTSGSNVHYLSNGNVSPTYTHISPKSKRSISSSQSLNKYLYSLSSESSSVSTIKLNGKYGADTTPISTTVHNPQPPVNHIVGVDADSGRASMASNIDQEQHSPVFQHSSGENSYKATITKISQSQYLNPYAGNSQNEMNLKKQQQQQQQQKITPIITSNSSSSNESTLKSNKIKKSKSQNEVHNSLHHTANIAHNDDPEDDQVSAV